MATNGNQAINQQALEATLRQAAQAIPPAAMPPADIEHNVIALMEALAKRCRAVVDTMVANAASDKTEADEFTSHLLDLCRRWGRDQIERKRRELVELEQFLGKVGK